MRLLILLGMMPVVLAGSAVHAQLSPGAVPLGSRPYSAFDVELPDDIADAAPKPTASPFRPLQFENDFSYLDAPTAVPVDFFDSLKRVRPIFGDSVDFGAEYRIRFQRERNLRLTGPDRSDHVLHRLRLYSDIWFTRQIRLYVERIDAVGEGEDIPGKPHDENRSDLLNAFLQWNVVGERGDSDLLAIRVGRQQMTLGSQRLAGHRNWRNMPLTYDGVRMLWTSELASGSLFYLHPIDNGQHPGHDHNFDQSDASRRFTGLYTSFGERGSFTLEPFFLSLMEDDRLVMGSNGRRGGFSAHTFGLRSAGTAGSHKWDHEGGWQVGDFADDDHLAWYFATDFGFAPPDTAWSPEFWVGYDIASGDGNLADGTNRTFNDLNPRGHYYLGWADVVGRRNIRDLNARIVAKPHSKLTTILWYHYFTLDQARDALYSPGGRVRRLDPTGASGRSIGHELDFSVAFRLQRHVQLFAGYARLFSGNYLRNTGDGRDVSLLYAGTTLQF